MFASFISHEVFLYNPRLLRGNGTTPTILPPSPQISSTLSIWISSSISVSHSSHSSSL